MEFEMQMERNKVEQQSHWGNPVQEFSSIR